MLMIAAVPNIGKSSFALYMLAKWAQQGVPSLVFSADQDEWTAMTKFTAAVTGMSFRQVQQSDCEEAVRGLPVWWCWDSSPSVEDISLEVDAWCETYDNWPEVILIDNLVNVEGSGDVQWDQAIVAQLHSLARVTKALVIVLVHASENEVKDRAWPPGPKAIINKLSKLPETVITLGADPDQGVMRLALGKSREAKADPKAEHSIALGFDYERMQIHGFHAWS